MKSNWCNYFANRKAVDLPLYRMLLEEEIQNLLANSRIDKLDIPEIFGDYQVSIMRDDLIHPAISGNKLRKLKHNLLAANKQGKSVLLTFGGAYSNHIAAVAAAGKLFGFRTIGYIRGAELNPESNQTLIDAQTNGMELRFLSREDYRSYREFDKINELQIENPSAYIIPEGGANDFGIRGCADALEGLDYDFTDLCCAIGTGTTFLGYVTGLKDGQRIHGFPVLKENYLKEHFQSKLLEMGFGDKDWQLHSSFYFGGYAKVSQQLIDFIADYQRLSSTFAEPVYTGKLLYGVHKLCKENFFPKEAKLLIIHTGGLQGWNGYADYQPFKK